MNRMLILPVIAFSISGLLFIILAVGVATSTPPAFDIDVLVYFAERSSSMATGVFRHISWAGSIFLLAPTGLVISYILVVRKRMADAVYFATSLTLVAIAARLLKYLIARERPDAYPELVETYFVYAFPSVHAAQITAFCLALYLVLTRCRLAWRVMAGVILLLLAVGVMCSRLYLQIHYPSDVIGGGLLGIICALGCYMLFISGGARVH